MIYEIIWTDVVEETTPEWAKQTPHYQHWKPRSSRRIRSSRTTCSWKDEASSLHKYGWLVAGARLGFVIGIMQSYEFQNHGWWPIRVYTSHFCWGSLRNLCSLVLKPERNRFAADWVCAILETFRWSISMLNSDPLPGRMFPKLPIISKSDSSDLPAVLWQRWIRLDVHGNQRLYT